MKKWKLFSVIIVIIIMIFVGSVFWQKSARNPKEKWEIFYFVDDFGDKTDKKYLSTKDYIIGQEVWAKSRKDIYIDIIITKDRISFELKGIRLYDKNMYIMHVKDSFGNIQYFTSCKYDERIERIYLNENESNILHKMLLKGGEVKFLFSENEPIFSINQKKYSNIINYNRYIQWSLNADGYPKGYNTVIGK